MPVPPERDSPSEMPLEGATRRCEPLEEGVREIIERVAALQVVWVAAASRPPDAHVLDTLVRQFVLDDAADEDPAVLFRPQAWTVAVVDDELPCCDLCALRGCVTKARYDGPVDRTEDSRWGFMCERCYRERSTGVLGCGRGQYLLAWDEISGDVREAFRRAKSYWRNRGVRSPEQDPWDEVEVDHVG